MFHRRIDARHPSARLLEFVQTGAHCHALHSVPAFSPRDPAGDEVGRAQRFGHGAAHLQSPDESLGIRKRQAGTLHVEPRRRFHRAGTLDQPSLARAAPHMAEQGTAHGIEIGRPTHDDDSADAQRLAEVVQIDDVEAGERDPLQQDHLHLGRKA